jgi:hypothetical protein
LIPGFDEGRFYAFRKFPRLKAHFSLGLYAKSGKEQIQQSRGDRSSVLTFVGLRLRDARGCNHRNQECNRSMFHLGLPFCIDG